MAAPALRFGVFDQSEQPGDLGLGELYRSRLAMVQRADELGFWGTTSPSTT